MCVFVCLFVCVFVDVCFWFVCLFFVVFARGVQLSLCFLINDVNCDAFRCLTVACFEPMHFGKEQ